MNMKVEANLKWLKPEEGGRQTLPSGPKYTTVARFANQQETWLQEAWSLVVEFTDAPDTSLSHRVRISFLAENGPGEFLQPGNTFELMEAAQPVATGIIIG